jgi:hypothetical protein
MDYDRRTTDKVPPLGFQIAMIVLLTVNLGALLGLLTRAAC